MTARASGAIGKGDRVTYEPGFFARMDLWPASWKGRVGTVQSLEKYDDVGNVLARVLWDSGSRSPILVKHLRRAV